MLNLRNCASKSIERNRVFILFYCVHIGLVLMHYVYAYIMTVSCVAASPTVRAIPIISVYDKWHSAVFWPIIHARVSVRPARRRNVQCVISYWGSISPSSSPSSSASARFWHTAEAVCLSRWNIALALSGRQGRGADPVSSSVSTLLLSPATTAEELLTLDWFSDKCKSLE